ncbi:hypothetical protein IW262DRAFT_1281667, partial [Armillaria fumosa]
VNRMPESMSQQIDNIVRGFAWDNKEKTPVNRTIMTAQKGKGGLQVLNIRLRSKAIEVMQLKSYLQLNKDRPIAAYVTDAIINRNVKDERVRKDAIVNTFLQTWSAQLQKNPHLPMHIKSMLIIVKELHVHLDMLAPSIKIHNQIPV